MPIEAFELEKQREVVQTLGLQAVDAPGFQIVLLVEMSKARAEKILPQVLPGFDEMAVILVDDASLPSSHQLEEASTKPVSLRSAIGLLAVEVAKPTPSEGAATTAASTEEMVAINDVDFEYLEKFGEDWQDRWPLPQRAGTEETQG